VADDSTPAGKRCEQCGRTGTRQFTTYPGDPIKGVPPITVCAVINACRSRWPRRAEDEGLGSW
jgi:hypothetical protein